MADVVLFKRKRTPIKGNPYAVPARAWRRWSEAGQRAFNEMMGTMLRQDIVKHPMAATVHPEHWYTTAYNAAFLAADAVDAALARAGGKAA
jgi:hypothetical protein